MNRREFIKLIAGSAAVWPLAAHAQTPALPVIGFLSAEWPDLFADRLRGFHAGLGQAGYVERQNVILEYRWAEGRIDQLPTLAADLVRRQVNVIVAVGSGTGGKGSDQYNSNRFLRRNRPSQNWACRQLQPTWRQHHRRNHPKRADSGEAAGAAARAAAQSDCHCGARQSG
jgi:hypothetical protein